jgi:hypothetical protein
MDPEIGSDARNRTAALTSAGVTEEGAASSIMDEALGQGINSFDAARCLRRPADGASSST